MGSDWIRTWNRSVSKQWWSLQQTCKTSWVSSQRLISVWLDSILKCHGRIRHVMWAGRSQSFCFPQESHRHEESGKSAVEHHDRLYCVRPGILLRSYLLSIKLTMCCISKSQKEEASVKVSLLWYHWGHGLPGFRDSTDRPVLEKY